MSVEVCRSLFPVGEAYRVIYADPPWEYEQRGNLKPKPYPTMAFSELAALPVRDIAASDSCLFMWATSPLMGEAVKLIEAWGFRYVCVYKVWKKKTAHGKPAVTPGFWSLGSCEFLLLGVRGAMQRFKRVFDVKQELDHERGAHSEKPACVREEIARLLDAEKRIELFARGETPGWDAWGLDVDGYMRTDASLAKRSCELAKKIRVILCVVDGAVRLAHDTRTMRSVGTQTQAVGRASEAASISASPQKLAASVDRVLVSRDGVPVRGTARPGRKGFDAWWKSKMRDGRPRSSVYTVDPADPLAAEYAV
jgi:N6-adenosine-specific RNA methylase IME4